MEYNNSDGPGRKHLGSGAEDSGGGTKISSPTNLNNNSHRSAKKNDGIAETPKPPYYAAIFTSNRNTNQDVASDQDYANTANRMVELAAQEEGFLGFESARDGLGITVSYWSNLESIKHWKCHTEHLVAQDKGQKQWYSSYKTRICLVERDYGF